MPLPRWRYCDELKILVEIKSNCDAGQPALKRLESRLRNASNQTNHLRKVN